jgi:predicted NAD-dependent protein-ADP-ribosyltransferase YbiA (DUF1768 family)
MTIYFYTTTDEYGAFSNFSLHGTKMQKYWGCGKDGTGLNTLGKVLVEVRTTLLDSRESF